MVEMAFKVNPGTTFYKNYFATKEEKAHFIEIAKQFFDKYFPDEKLSYVLNDRLTVDLKPELLAKYESQVMKRRDPHGFVIFKQRSPMNCLWEDEVCKNVNARNSLPTSSGGPTSTVLAASLRSCGMMSREISTDIIPANMQLAALRFQTPLRRLS